MTTLRTLNNIVLDIPSFIHGYYIQRTIHVGKYSIIKVAIGKNDNIVYAAKIMSYSFLIEHNKIELYNAYIRNSSLFIHQNVLKVYQSFIENDLFIIIMEYCDNQSISTFIYENGVLSENDAQKIFRDLIKGVLYIHSKSYCHLNLSTDTIFLDSQMNVKISGFYNPKKVIPHQYMTENSGFLNFAPPEAVLCKPFDGFKYDIWSLGIILIFILEGHLPWDSTNQNEVTNSIISLKYEPPKHVSRSCSDFLSHLLTYNFSSRSSISDLHVHPWIMDTFFPMNISLSEFPSLPSSTSGSSRSLLTSTVEKMTIKKTSTIYIPLKNNKRSSLPNKQIIDTFVFKKGSK